MEARDQRLLDGLRAGEVLTEYYRQGGTPAGARTGSEKLVAPYLQSRGRLSEIPIELLFPMAREIATIVSNGAEDAFVNLLTLYRKAHRHDPTACFRVFLEDQQSLDDSLAVFWSLYHLQRERESLELDEFMHETLRNIGAILEGLVKPLVVASSRQVQLPTLPRQAIAAERLSFGQALQVVGDALPDSSLMEILGVPINQWRNIAQHFSASVQGDHVSCRYGAKEQHVIRLTRRQLDSVLRSSMILFRTLKGSRELFFLDHMYDMRDAGLLPPPDLKRQRPEASFAVCLAAIASQGFAVISTSQSAEWSALVVQDVSNLPSDTRRVHASQFVAPLALFRPAPMLSIEYRERDGTPSLLTIAPLELVERANSTGNASLIAEEATFIDLKNLSPEDLARIGRSDG